MRVNNTTNMPNELIREIIAFVRPSGLSKFDVMVKNGEHIAGRAYYKGSGYHSTADPFIVCRIPETKGTKKTYAQMGAITLKQIITNYPRLLHTYQIGHLKDKRYWLADRTECLVYIIAHELRHIWQAGMKNKRGYYPKSRGKFSEIDSEGYALTMLRAWRKRNNK